MTEDFYDVYRFNSVRDDDRLNGDGQFGESVKRLTSDDICAFRFSVATQWCADNMEPGTYIIVTLNKLLSNPKMKLFKLETVPTVARKVVPV